MWPFRKPSPVLTNAAYSRWLRAQRPTLLWFLGMTELEQEQLALLGDLHARDFAVAVGWAVSNPQLAEAGSAAAGGDVGGEETLARQVAGNLVRRILARGSGGDGGRAAASPATMAGFGERSAAASQAAKAALNGGRRFLGRAPGKAAP